ncbi:MAG: hypothetical protein KKD38_01225, partial [Candidatus Delongbacteria bacterium]|nr:hypothetical protein [Candidatus Delongbacteria bacterium]MCG2760319.1 hypothetical protein [Candidatus Delongbacteria bacterium]
EVLCLSCNKEHTGALNKIKKLYPESKTSIIELRQPLRYRFFNFKKKSYPSVNAMIKIAKKYLIDTDCILTTSHGTPKMLAKNKINKQILIYQYHGCGDRKYGFDPGFKRFNYMFLPGIYHQNRLTEEDIIAKEKTFIVGWPKFDYSLKVSPEGEKLFSNDNPVVLYTPHWEPKLTSFNKYSEFLLNYFKINKNYNFIFAPHILIKHWKTHYGYRTDFSEYESDNIIIDFGSDFSTDGTYLNNSDMYIGDVSSMVYEFIAFKQRPCLFLNAHNVAWKDNVDYRFWDYGPVVESQDDFDIKFKEAFSDEKFIEIQKSRIKEYFDLTEENSSKRAAKSILYILNNNNKYIPC